MAPALRKLDGIDPRGQEKCLESGGQSAHWESNKYDLEFERDLGIYILRNIPLRFRIFSCWSME